MLAPSLVLMSAPGFGCPPGRYGWKPEKCEWCEACEACDSCE
jgi:hypothetical protein